MSWKKSALAICVGVVVLILTVLLLKVLFGLELLGVFIGVILGLETGYFTGDHQRAFFTHKKVFQSLISEKAKSLYSVVANLIFCGLVGVAWVFSFTWQFKFFPQLINFDLGEFAFALVLISFIVSAIICFGDIWESNAKSWLEHGKFLLLVLAVGIFAPTVVSLCLALIALALAVGVFVVLPVVFAICLYGFIVSIMKLSSDKSFVAITIGVLSGGFGGLIYGNFADVQFWSITTLSMCFVGCFVGLTSAGTFALLGRLKFVVSSFQWYSKMFCK